MKIPSSESICLYSYYELINLFSFISHFHYVLYSLLLGGLHQCLRDDWNKSKSQTFKFHPWISKIPTLSTEIYICKIQKLFTTFSEHCIMFFAITLCNNFKCESLQTLCDCAHDLQWICSSLCFCHFHWHPVQPSWNLVWDLLIWGAVFPGRDRALAKKSKRIWKQWTLKQNFKLGKNLNSMHFS